MVTESPRVHFSLEPKWDWKTVLDTVPSTPVSIEIWVSTSPPRCIGRTALQYNGSEVALEQNVALQPPTQSVQDALVARQQQEEQLRVQQQQRLQEEQQLQQQGEAAAVVAAAVAATDGVPPVLEVPVIQASAILAAGAAVASAHYGTLSLKWQWTQGKDLLHELIDTKRDLDENFVHGASQSSNLLDKW